VGLALDAEREEELVEVPAWDQSQSTMRRCGSCRHTCCREDYAAFDRSRKVSGEARG
jgi:hypothetical protein